MIQRMNNPGARAERDRRLVKPAFQRRPRLIFNNSGRQRFRTERQEVRDSPGAADELNFAAESSRSYIERVVDQQSARRDERTFAQIQRVSEPKRVYEIRGVPEKPRGDRGLRDFDVANGKDQTGFVLFCDFAVELDPVAQFEFGISIISETERGGPVSKTEVGI